MAAIAGEMRQLRFNAKISSRVATADLTRRLKELHIELKDLIQDQTDLATLTTYAQDLVKTELLKHSDMGVKILVACCLAELLRLYAPDAPYKDAVLLQVLQMFIQQLHGLREIHGPNIKRYQMLLESLATVKTFILLTSLDATSDIQDLFQLFFDVASEEHAESTRGCMVEIMQQLVEELDELSPELLDITLNQFVLKKRASTTAQQMAGDLVSSLALKFQTYITKYFQEVHASGAEGSTSDLGTPEIAHMIVVQLYKTAPQALLHVMPLVEEELRNMDVTIRELAVKSLGEMFCLPRSTLAEAYPSIWKTWLERSSDIEPKIRIDCIAFVPDLLVNQPGLTGELNESLANKLLDPDERVRQTTCKMLGDLREEAIQRLTKTSLDALMDRCLDKKAPVRTAAIIAIASIFQTVLGKTYSRDDVTLNPDLVDLVSPLLCKLLSFVMNAEDDVRRETERILMEEIIPVGTGTERDIARSLCGLYSLCYHHKSARNGFQLLFQLQAKCQERGSELFRALTGANEENYQADTGTLMATASQIINISRLLPDPARTQDNLKKIIELKDAVIYKAMANAMEKDSTHAAIRKAIDQSIGRLKTKPLLADYTRFLLQRCSLSILNRSTLGAALALIDEWKDGSTAASLRLLEGGIMLLKDVSKLTPQLLSPVFGTLLTWLNDDEGSVTSNAALEALANGHEHFEPSLITTKSTRRVLDEAAMSLDAQRAARALRVMSSLADTKSLLKATVQTLVNVLSADSLENEAEEESWALISSALCALSEATTCAPALITTHHNELLDFVIKDLLPCAPPKSARSPKKQARRAKDTSKRKGKKRSTDDDDHLEPMDDDNDTDDEPLRFIEDMDMPKDLAAKLAGVVFLSKFLSANSSVAPDARDLQAPFVALVGLLMKQGEPRSESPFTKASHRARLLLCVAQEVLNLATLNQFTAVLSSGMVLQLACVLQHALPQVRAIFFDHLFSLLTSLKLPIMYTSLLFFAIPEETDKEQIELIKRQTASLVQACRRVANDHKGDPTVSAKVLPEFAYPHLMSMLAHHPHFTDAGSSEQLMTFSKYLEHYMDTVLTSDNLSFLYQSTTNIKMHSDAIDADRSTFLYALADVSFLIMQDRAKHNNWSIETYPGTITLPPALFRPLPTTEATRIARQVFLPESFPRRQMPSGTAKRSVGQKHTLPKSPSKASAPAAAKHKAPPAATTNDGMDVATAAADTASPRRSPRKRSAQTTMAEASSDSDENGSEEDDNDADALYGAEPVKPRTRRRQ